MKTFSELEINPILKHNLERAKFIVPTPVQAGVIEPALAGRDILGTAQTGTGKTLAFALPILERLMQKKPQGVEALVLVPTRELAMQVWATFETVGRESRISGALAIGGLSEAKQIAEIRHGARVVIATPGRLDDYVSRGLVNLRTVKILVLDEADRMVDMGFLPQMKRIMSAVPPERQTMCFSATLERSVAHLVHQYLRAPVRIEIGSTLKPAESVALKIYEVAREQKLPLLCRLLETESGTFLVFTRTKYGADRVVRKLTQKGFDAAVLHGGKTQSQRTRALEGFKLGRHRALIATDIAARGIHVSGIAHVINYDLPQAAEDFIHRVGRTGRVEESGTATTFVMPEEARDAAMIERTLGKKIERVALPAGLAAEPRSLHAEAMDFQSRRLGGRRGAPRPLRQFGFRRRR